MGMYDNFIPSKPVKCPNCGKDLTSGDPDLPYACVLQSKALRCLLDEYQQGEIIEDNPESEFSIKDGWIKAGDYCENCKKYFDFKLIIENGVWTRTENWKNE